MVPLVVSLAPLSVALLVPLVASPVPLVVPLVVLLVLPLAVVEPGQAQLLMKRLARPFRQAPSERPRLHSSPLSFAPANVSADVLAMAPEPLCQPPWPPVVWPPCP
eukprot:Skav233243  [mRNA]  locus=scaffold2786:40993:44446:+ [translate_table: standard]